MDGRIPRYAAFVTKNKTIHFDPPDPIIESMGQHVRACTGGPLAPDYDHGATGVHSVVNCKECKESEIYQKTLPPPSEGKPPVQDGMVTVENGRIKITEEK